MLKELFNYYKNAMLDDHLCEEYKGIWQACGEDKEKLISLAMQQQVIGHVATYAYLGKGITRDFVLREFGDYINGYILHDCDNVEGYTYGMFVDYQCSDYHRLVTDVSHFMWTNDVRLIVSPTKCPIIYVSNGSKVSLVCEGYNFVKVYLYDESEIILEDVDVDCAVSVYKYSDNAKVERGAFAFTKELKVFDKEIKF